MARTRTTWGPGQGGKPKGAKDTVPRSFKSAVRLAFERVMTKDPAILDAAIERGLKSRRSKDNYPWARLCAELYGELKQQVELSGAVTVSDEQLGDIRQQLDQLAAKYAAGGVVKAGVAE